jgi:hypothetical protein
MVFRVSRNTGLPEVKSTLLQALTEKFVERFGKMTRGKPSVNKRKIAKLQPRPAPGNSATLMYFAVAYRMGKGLASLIT